MRFLNSKATAHTQSKKSCGSTVQTNWHITRTDMCKLASIRKKLNLKTRLTNKLITTIINGFQNHGGRMPIQTPRVAELQSMSGW